MPFQFLDIFKENTRNILLKTCKYNLYIAHILVLGQSSHSFRDSRCEFSACNMNALNIYEQTSASLGFTLHATS